MSADQPAVLGVERSLGGQRWYEREAMPHIAEALAQRLGIPDIVGRVLAARGIGLDDAEQFLSPTLRHALPDPCQLRDMEKAASRFANAIMAGEDIVIFGDYDVDGATSAALLLRFARASQARIRHYIPDRVKEGYGPNAPALQGLAAEGAKLVITVDCGIQAFEALAAGSDAGLDIIVIDHHQAISELPRAHAIVNPNRLDDESGLHQLAAVGVAFLFAVATNRVLRNSGWYGNERQEPDLLRLLDLVALGTICDVVPLTGLNRVFVRQGLKVMSERANAGLRALADVAGMGAAPGTYHAGFILGPRVNAGGRVGEADLGTRLLAEDDYDAALITARHLHDLNSARQEIEAQVLQQALAQVGDPGAAPAIIAAGEGWHAGVIGIVASRLKEKFHRPAIVVALNAAQSKGSARSIAGVDIGAAMLEAKRRGLLVNGGGHAMAAGLTLEASKLETLRLFLMEYLTPKVAKARKESGLALDGLMTGRAVTPELAEILEQAGPYGVGNPSPRFAWAGLSVFRADIVGRDHVRAFLGHADGARLNAIFFRAAETAAGQALLNAQGRRFHIAGKLKRDDWGGRVKVDVVLDDVAPANPA